jgi:hypothetical protein
MTWKQAKGTALSATFLALLLLLYAHILYFIRHSYG